MSNISQTQYNLRLFDDLSKKDAGFSRIHPVIQLITTFAYLVITVSFDAAEITGLLPLTLYPVILFTANEIPIKPIFFRLIFALPFMLGIGILNPIFDQQPVTTEMLTLSRGWLTFFSIVLKGTLTILAALLLLSSCGLSKLAKSLRLLKVPKLLVIQLLLTYRYLSVLLDEVVRTMTAYSLRAPEHRGVGYKAWGSLLGQLLLRTFDRAERVYEAMCLRGFDGDYPDEPVHKVKAADILYGLLWVSYFIFVRQVNIPLLLGGFI